MTDDAVIARALSILEKRARTGSALTSPGAVRDFLRLTLHDKEHEEFWCLYLDAQHRVLGSRPSFEERSRRPRSTRGKS